MEIYLVNAETNKVISTFRNVKSWNTNFVLFDNNGYIGKVYCSKNEYFTDKIETDT